MTTPLTADGAPVPNPLVSLTLRGPDESTGVAPVAADEVTGFGGLREIAFELAVTAVSLSGGTATLTVWVQRKTPTGQWDDLLALKTASLASGAAAAYVVGDHRSVTAAQLAPAAVQDGGGAPPFASRSGWVSDALRVKSLITVSGGQTSQSMTWAVYARGRA